MSFSKRNTFSGKTNGGGSKSRGHGSHKSNFRSKRRLPLDHPATSPETLSKIESSLDLGDYIVFDIETTGGNPEKNGITEIFAVRYRKNQVEDTFYSLVNPGIPIPPIVRRMTGIDNKMVRGAPRIDEVMPDIISFIGNDVLVSHNTIGDMKFVRYFARKVAGVTLENYYLCTHLLVEKLVPEAPDKSLKGLAGYFKLPQGELHRAEADAYVTLELFKVLLGKLKERSIRRIDEAIRLQGDLESGMRLGWGVNPQALDVVPSGPGVFYLYDHERKLIFLSSATHLDREVAKLKSFQQLPRQLLRLVLRSYDIQTHRCANVFAAMLEECEALQSHAISFQPSSWHQRLVPAICIIEENEKELRLSVGSIEEGTRHAFGPVRDRKQSSELVDKIAVTLGAVATRHGAIFDKSLEPVLVAFFEGRLDHEIDALQKRVSSFSMLFRWQQRQQLKQQLHMMKSLSSLTGKLRFHSYLERSGVLIVPDRQAGAWQIHSIVAGRPRSMTILRGEPEARFKLAGFGKRIEEKIRKELETLKGVALGSAEAARVNATLWWLMNGRSDGKFIPLEELEKFEVSRATQGTEPSPVELS